MTKIQKLLILSLALFLPLFAVVLPPQPAAAQCGSPDACEQAAEACRNGGGTWDGTAGRCIESEGAQMNFVENDCNEDVINQDNCGIIGYIVLIINVLSALVGAVIVISLIVAGIQYSTSGADPQKVSAAKNRIRNAVIALVFFIFSYAFLNYLVPGGVL